MSISILAPLAGRDFSGIPPLADAGISILAPLAGRDQNLDYARKHHFDFNPRAPCGARQHEAIPRNQLCQISILAPLAGRDYERIQNCRWTKNFNPRAPCGARRQGGACGHAGGSISILAPLAGRDPLSPPSGTLPAISILAPLAGRDLFRNSATGRCRNFNPRAPCGARRLATANLRLWFPFQSSRPLRGATSQKYRPLQNRGISILAPLAGRDPHRSDLDGRSHSISILAPLAGRDFTSLDSCAIRWISILAPLAGRDGLILTPTLT